MSNHQDFISAIRRAGNESELRHLIIDSLSSVPNDSGALSLYIVNMIVVFQGLKSEKIPLAEFENVSTAIRILREFRGGLRDDPFDSLTI